MKTLYLDLISGLSGDMFLGALLDLGVDFKQLERELGKLALEGYHLHATRRQKGSIEGVKFDVHLSEAHDHAHDEHGHHHHHHEHEHHEHEEHHHPHTHAHEDSHSHGDSHITHHTSPSTATH